MRHGSLFSGVGGFDLAASWMKWDNVFNCENNLFCRRILRHYWPQTVSYEDIKAFDGSRYKGTIDVISGGFPCQPFSHAGKRKGIVDERYLWPQMLRVVGEIRPGWVVGENVFGLVNWERGLVFRKVLTDLESEGYEVWPYLLPAGAVGAPHQRNRIFFIGCRKDHFDKWISNAERRREIFSGADRKKSSQSFLPQGNVADTDRNERFKGGMHQAGPEETERYTGTRHPWNARYPWKDFPSESPICSGNDGLSYELDRITFSTWRKESLKAYGNAVCPQVAWQIFKAIEEVGRLKSGAA